MYLSVTLLLCWKISLCAFSIVTKLGHTYDTGITDTYSIMIPYQLGDTFASCFKITRFQMSLRRKFTALSVYCAEVYHPIYSYTAYQMS